jgi:subtilisin
MAESPTRRRFVLLPVRGTRAGGPGVTRLAAGLLTSLARYVGGRAVRPLAEVPQVELTVVDSVREDGPKLVEVSPEAAIALRATAPSLRLVPLVYYRPAVAPRLVPMADAAIAVSDAPARFRVRVSGGAGGTPLPGCTVVVFTDFPARRGAQATTGADGTVTLQLGASVNRLERVYAYPPGPGYWGALATDVPVSADLDLELTALDLARPDCLRHFYGGHPAEAGAGVRVGVVDTGVDLSHPDLVVAGGENTVPGEDPGNFGPNGHDHGSHVAGIVAGRGVPGRGVRGVAPAVDLHSFRVFGEGESAASNYAIIKAVDRAVAAGCDLVNLSLSGGVPDAATRAAVEDARAQGTLLVAAAGNDRRGPVGFPASHPLVVAVSAMGHLGLFPARAVEAGDVAPPYGRDPLDFLADFSNIGPEIDVIGPGVGVVSTVPGGHAPMSGTSMAAPAVTGAAAVLLSNRRDLLELPRDQSRSDALAQALFEASTSLGFEIEVEGHGLPNRRRLAE